MSKPLEFKVVRGNPTIEEIAAIEMALKLAKNSSEELLKQKSKISNWNKTRRDYEFEKRQFYKGV